MSVRGLRTRATRGPLLLAVTVGAILLGACGRAAEPPQAGGDRSAGAATKVARAAAESPGTTAAPTTPPPEPTTVEPLDPDEVEVRAVMDRFWPAYLAAMTTPDPHNAELEAVLTGQAADEIIGGFQYRVDVGQRVVVPDGSVYDHHITSVRFDERGIAIVEECLVDDLVVTIPSTGVVVNDDVVTAQLRTTLAKSDDGWRITTRHEPQRLEGVRDCSLFTP